MGPTEEPGDGWEMPARPADVFAGPPRRGSLPRLFQPRNRWRTLGLGPEGLRSDQPLLDEEVLPPDPFPEPASTPEPEPKAPLPDPAPEEDSR